MIAIYYHKSKYLSLTTILTHRGLRNSWIQKNKLKEGRTKHMVKNSWLKKICFSILAMLMVNGISIVNINAMETDESNEEAAQTDSMIEPY